MKGTQEWTVEGKVVTMRDFAPGDLDTPSITRRVDLDDPLVAKLVARALEIGDPLDDSE